MMLTRRLFGRAIVTAAMVAAGPFAPAWANTAVPYSAEAFKAAQASGSPILVEIHADWCPTCKAQGPILDKLTADPKFKNLKNLPRRFRRDEAGRQAVRRADAVDPDCFQGRRRGGPFGR